MPVLVLTVSMAMCTLGCVLTLTEEHESDTHAAKEKVPWIYNTGQMSAQM